MYWTIQHKKDINLPQNRFNTILIKIPANFFVDIDKIILKFICESKEMRIGKEF